jgi:hypothetical protein
VTSSVQCQPRRDLLPYWWANYCSYSSYSHGLVGGIPQFTKMDGTMEKLRTLRIEAHSERKQLPHVNSLMFHPSPCHFCLIGHAMHLIALLLFCFILYQPIGYGLQLIIWFTFLALRDIRLLPVRFPRVRGPAFLSFFFSPRTLSTFSFLFLFSPRTLFLPFLSFFLTALHPLSGTPCFHRLQHEPRDLLSLMAIRVLSSHFSLY